MGLVTVVALTALSGGNEGPTAESTSTTTAAESVIDDPWFQSGEVLIGSTVLLPQSLDIQDGIAYFDYDLIGLAPTLHGDGGELGLGMPTGDPLALPEKWELTTVAGDIVSAETGPNNTSVRFELPGPEDEVASIDLVGWRIPVPFGDAAEMVVEEGATAELRRGTATAEVVLVQTISTIVQIDFEANSEDLWVSETVTLRPRDAHWQIGGRQGGGIQLTWSGDDAPDLLILEDVGFEWRPISGRISIHNEVISG